MGRGWREGGGRGEGGEGDGVQLGRIPETGQRPDGPPGAGKLQVSGCLFIEDNTEGCL